MPVIVAAPSVRGFYEKDLDTKCQDWRLANKFFTHFPCPKRDEGMLKGKIQKLENHYKPENMNFTPNQKTGLRVAFKTITGSYSLSIAAGTTSRLGPKHERIEWNI